MGNGKRSIRNPKNGVAGDIDNMQIPVMALIAVRKKVISNKFIRLTSHASIVNTFRRQTDKQTDKLKFLKLGMFALGAS